MQEVLVANDDRMMTAAAAGKDGIHLTFADGCSGVIPFKDLPEVKTGSNLRSLELPNPYELVVTDESGASHEIPWDFARHYCDPSYRPHVEAVAKGGRMSLGERIRLTVDEIPAHFPRVSRAAVSKHLRVLREARLVRRRHN